MSQTHKRDDLISIMFTVGRLMRAAEGFIANDCSLFHIKVLEFIAEKKNPTMKELAEYFVVTPPSATSLIELLVKTRLLRREADKNDRRTVRISVTAKGKKTLHEGLARSKLLIKKFFSGLTKQEIAEMESIMKKVIKLNS